MNNKKMPDRTIEKLIDELFNKDGKIRQSSRDELVHIGRPAIIYLKKVLRKSAIDQARWEAAKALADMDDEGVILPLVEALEDSFPDVQWLAAEGLKKYKIKAWPPLLRLLVKKGADSVLLRQGVHHVFTKQVEPGYEDLTAALLKALETGTAPELRLSTANEILKRLKKLPLTAEAKK